MNQKNSTPYWRAYEDASTPIDAKADDPKGQVRGAIGVYAGGNAGGTGANGTLVIRPPGAASDGSEDQTVTTVAGSPPLPIEFDSIQSGSATDLIVFWNRT